MVLGDPQFAGHIYSQDRLLSLLNGPTKGDASLILALQLIAAKLNLARTGYAPIADDGGAGRCVDGGVSPPPAVRSRQQDAGRDPDDRDRSDSRAIQHGSDSG